MPTMKLRFLLLSLILSLINASKLFAAEMDGKTFENWTIRCDVKGEKKECYLFQNLVSKEGGGRVLHIAVGYLDGGSMPVIMISMPLGISLPPGATIVVDAHEPLRYQIERCEMSGCRGGFRLNQAVLDQMRQGKRAVVTFYDANRNPIEVPVALAGFEAGMASLRLESQKQK